MARYKVAALLAPVRIVQVFTNNALLFPNPFGMLFTFRIQENTRGATAKPPKTTNLASKKLFYFYFFSFFIIPTDLYDTPVAFSPAGVYHWWSLPELTQLTNKHAHRFWAGNIRTTSWLRNSINGTGNVNIAHSRSTHRDPHLILLVNMESLPE